MSAQEDVQTGLLWPLLETEEVYHCPAHDNRTYNSQKLTSYIINSIIQDDFDDNWHRIGEFDSSFILFWEANEAHNGNMWNDGCDMSREDSNEKLTMRHGNNSSISSLDGSTKAITNPGFQALLNASASPLTSCPTHGYNSH